MKLRPRTARRVFAFCALILGVFATTPAFAKKPKAAHGRERTSKSHVAARALADVTIRESAEISDDALPPLVIMRGWDRSRYTLTPESREGGFDQHDLVEAKQAFAEHDSGRMHEVNPRLLDLAYRAMVHFGASEVRLVSGYRHDRIRCRHSHGRAMDISLPGVDYRELAAWAREQGFVGVGIYPQSEFVHLDVRSSSYFWVDYSAPGRRGRNRPIRMEEAARADSAARARGERADDDIVEAEAEEDELATNAHEPKHRRVGVHRRARRARASNPSPRG